MKKESLLLLLLFYCVSLNAQDTQKINSNGVGLLNSNNSTKQLGVSIGLSSVFEERFFYTSSVDYYFNPYINAVITYGRSFSTYPDNLFSIGFRKWLTHSFCQNHLYPYFGLSYRKIGLITDGEVANENVVWERKHFSFIETPIGISYVTKFGLQASVQLSHIFVYDHWSKDISSLVESPIALNYTTKLGLQASFQIGYFIRYDSGLELIGPNVELSLGWRFNFSNKNDIK